MSATTGELEQYYRAVLSDRMSDMPFVNPALEVEAIGHRRADRARMDRVDANAERPQFERGGLGEPANAPLAGDVRAEVRVPLQSGGGGDVDDRAVPSAQVGDGGPGAEEGAGEVAVDPGAPAGERECVDRARLRGRQARVVDEQVGSTGFAGLGLPGPPAVEGRGDADFFGDVGLEREERRRRDLLREL